MIVLFIDGPLAGQRMSLPPNIPFYETATRESETTYRQVMYIKQFSLGGITFFSVAIGAFVVQGRLVALIERGLQAEEKESKK